MSSNNNSSTENILNAPKAEAGNPFGLPDQTQPFEEHEEGHRTTHLIKKTQQRSFVARRMWLISFSDLTALMLTFFVMMFSMSSIKEGKWDELVQTFNSSFSPQRVEQRTAALGIDSFRIGYGQNLDYMAKTLPKTFEGLELLSQVKFGQNQNRLMLYLGSDVQFTQKTVNLKAPEQTQEMLRTLALTLNELPNQIEIEVALEGLDNLPNNEAERSELIQESLRMSLARGRKMARLFIAGGYLGLPIIVAGDISSPSKEQMSETTVAKENTEPDGNQVTILIGQILRGQ